jgi:nicotinamidase-related amidase
MTDSPYDDQLALAAAEARLPVAFQPYDITAQATGLVIVDEVNGFATVGAGNLAPQSYNAQVHTMVAETDRLARRFLGQASPVLAFLDSHQPGKPEPPYSPHCEAGTGEDELVPALQWLPDRDGVTLIRKDCINGFVGAIDVETGRNAVAEWIEGNRLEAIVVVGICTDICVMDFVLTALSARNHALLGGLRDIVVYAPACATYSLDLETARSLDLPDDAAHPQALTHHLGLYFMASRGALLTKELP